MTTRSPSVAHKEKEAATNSTSSHRCLSLLPLDLLRLVYSHLHLQEALSLLCTCRGILEASRIDAFRYVFLFHNDNNSRKFVQIQDKTLARLCANTLHILRTILLRNCLPQQQRLLLLERLQRHFIYNDNGSACELLLSHCSPTTTTSLLHDLEWALRRHGSHSTVAAVLQRSDTRIEALIQTCRECNVNIACTWCDGLQDCVQQPYSTTTTTTTATTSTVQRRYCMPCMEQYGSVCRVCQKEQCPACVRNSATLLQQPCSYCRQDCCCGVSCLLCGKVACRDCQQTQGTCRSFWNYSNHYHHYDDTNWKCMECL